MLSEDLVREIVALRRRVERLEAQEPVAGALRGPNAEIDARGYATLAGGLNVGTASGAAAGDVRASGTLWLGPIGARMNMNASTLADDETDTILSGGGAGYGLFVVYCPSEGRVALCSRSGSIVTIISDPLDVFRNTDTDGYHCVYVDGADLILKNRRGVSRNYRIHHFG